MNIRLSSAEMAVAAQVAALRQIAAVQAERPDLYGADKANGLSLHAEGAAGELAVAKSLGIYWTPTVNTFKSGGDVGEFQVRTRSRPDYDLIVRPSDPNAIYILVLGQTPFFEVAGWITSSEAKQDRFWKTYGNRPGAWFVPRAELHHMSLLPQTHPAVAA